MLRWRFNRSSPLSLFAYIHWFLCRFLTCDERGQHNVNRRSTDPCLLSHTLATPSRMSGAKQPRTAFALPATLRNVQDIPYLPDVDSAIRGANLVALQASFVD